MINKIILPILLTLVVISTHGQTKTLKGIALDKGEKPVPWCNVFLKGSTNGTITDVCGEFQLTTNEKEVTVIFSCLTSDLRAFEAIVKTTDFNEGDKVIFLLRGHWKMKNKDCKKKIEKGLKKYTID